MVPRPCIPRGQRENYPFLSQGKQRRQPQGGAQGRRPSCCRLQPLARRWSDRGAAAAAAAAAQFSRCGRASGQRLFLPLLFFPRFPLGKPAAPRPPLSLPPGKVPPAPGCPARGKKTGEGKLRERAHFAIFLRLGQAEKSPSGNQRSPRGGRQARPRSTSLPPPPS